LLNGSINHLSLTVSDLGAAMQFFEPFLEFLGYVCDTSGSPVLRVNLSPGTGGAVNIWQAKEELRDHPFQLYAPGLHHVSFNVDARDKIDLLAENVPQWGGRVTNPPATWPYTNVGEYYAIYLLGPDDLKLECVWMSELARLHALKGTLHVRLWPHADG
jgi:catechol 2,3-dioxygenase-like lactoylglutathione lyase family enzyme